MFDSDEDARGIETWSFNKSLWSESLSSSPPCSSKFFPVRRYRSILCLLHTHRCMIKLVSEILQMTAKEKAEGGLLSLMAPQSVCDSTRYLARRHQRHICWLSPSSCATRADLPLIWAFYVGDLQKRVEAHGYNLA